MKLLVWNILQGGGKRRQRIAAFIHAHNPDIVALIEFIPSTAGPLLQAFRDTGLEHQLCTQRNGFNYAVCVLSKTPIIHIPSRIPILDDSGLWLEVAVPEQGFTLGVVHAPTSPRSRMKDFLTALVQYGSMKIGDPFLMVGDFNTGIGPADGPLKNFGDVDRFIALHDAGLKDAWRYIHGDRIEYTWCRSENSYRIDHALASPYLLPRIRDCRYSHPERESGASDHSLLLIEIG